jgi:hypothetical protein
MDSSRSPWCAKTRSARGDPILYQSCLPRRTTSINHILLLNPDEVNYRSSSICIASNNAGTHCSPYLFTSKANDFISCRRCTRAYATYDQSGKIEGREDKLPHPFRATPEKPTTFFSVQILRHQWKRIIVRSRCFSLWFERHCNLSAGRSIDCLCSPTWAG